MQLGIVLAPYGQVKNAWPYEMGYAFGGDGRTYLCPPDAQYLTRGEYGYYHDTPLGAAQRRPGFLKRLLGLGATDDRSPRAPDERGYPNTDGTTLTDFDLGTIYGYTPVSQGGWIATKEGYVPNGYLPPSNQHSNGAYGPVTWPLDRALGDAAPAPVTAADVVAIMNEQNSKIFTLTLITTIAGAAAYLLMAYRQGKAIKRGV
jgi:hypothetical protein